MSSPVFSEMLLSLDGRTTAIQVNFPFDQVLADAVNARTDLREKRLDKVITTEEAEELAKLETEINSMRVATNAKQSRQVASVRSIIAEFQDRAQLNLGGVPMVSNDMLSYIRSDLKVFGAGMVIFLIGMLTFFFGHVRWVVLPMLSCGCSLLVMLGIVGLMDWPVTVISANFISLQLIITMALNIHLIVRYTEVHYKHPDEKDQRVLVRETVRTIFIPCLYTSLTTVAGFASLLACGILPVMNFGWMMSAGLVVSLIVTFLLFPAAATCLLVHDPKEDRFRFSLTGVFARITDRLTIPVLLVTCLVAIVTMIGISRLQVENSFVNYFRESTEIHKGMTLIDSELGGTAPLELIINFNSPTDTADADDAPKVAADVEADPDWAFGEDEEEEEEEDEDFDDFDEFEDDEEEEDSSNKYWYTQQKMDTVTAAHEYLESLDAVGKVLSLTTVVRVAEQLTEGEKLDSFGLALLFSQLPEDFREVILDPYVDIEQNRVRINMRIKDSAPELRREELLVQMRKELQEKVGLEPDQFRLTGLMVLYNNMLQSLFSSQIKTIGWTVAALFFMFLLLFQSVRIAIIAILPNLLASVTVLGVMGLAEIPLDMMTITIVAICIGIAVDNTIHYIHRFRREFEKNPSYRETMHICHGSIGNAMYYTSITIIVGFAILALSNFIPSVLFGLLTGVAMLMALLGALTVLPSMIIVLKPFGPEPS